MSQTEPELIEDLRQLFIDDVPLLDVRAPVEFAEGAFPGAENHPLIDDAERHEIGIRYNDEGQDRAIELGESLVSGDARAQRIDAWRDFLTRHPNAVLYCFRGGMRSKISQRWLLEEAGIRCPRVRGGYKALRRFLLDELDRNSANARPVVIGGRTGVGKTRLLEMCSPMLDLEGLANHRGSAFGNHPQPQPTQIDFENAVSAQLIKRVADSNRPFVVEDESRNIGSRHVPVCLHDAMQKAPLVLLEASDEERVDITLQEYVHDALEEFAAVYGEDQGFDRWADYLTGSLDRIQRRLGGERHAQVSKQLRNAIEQHRTSGETAAHRAWIANLLHEYYDGMYNYQLNGKQERIVFRGDRASVLQYLAEHYNVEVNAP